MLTTLGSIPIAEYATPSTAELPDAVRKYIKAHDGMLLANHGALTVGADLFAAYYKMETIEHFAKISLVARLLGRENLIAREEVVRLQGLRGTYGIKAPAPICADPASATARGDDPARLPGRPGARRRRAASRAGRRRPQRRGSTPDRWRCGNSVNIPRTLRAHRRRDTELTLESQTADCGCKLALSLMPLPVRRRQSWVRRLG